MKHHHEEAKREDPRPHHLHLHLPDSGRRDLRRAGVAGGDDPEEGAVPEESGAPEDVQLVRGGLRQAGEGGAAAEAAQSRGAVEVRRLVLLRHHRDHDHR